VISYPLLFKTLNLRCAGFVLISAITSLRTNWRHKRITLIGLLSCSCFICFNASAQFIPIGDPFEDYARFLQLKGVLPFSSFNVRPLAAERLYNAGQSETGHPWQDLISTYSDSGAGSWVGAGIFEPTLNTFWNSSRPFGQNDGAVWQGRGGTVFLSSGVFTKAGPLSMALRPQFMYNQNSHFELWPGTGFQYADRSTTIDSPQRFGPDPYTMWDLGQSYVRLDYKGAAAGISNENMWWGPARQNAIVMSNNAPGFPHAFIGTSHPVGVGIADFQAKWLWGRLTESEYFDTDEENNQRFVTGIILDLSPRFVPGLSLGVTRVFYRTMPDRLSTDNYLLVFQHFLKIHTTQEIGGISDPMDQILSVYMRWLLPESGFEVYSELARGDHSGDLRDVALEPEHAIGYTLGFQRAFTAWGGREMHLNTELTKLQAPRAAILRRSPSASYFYVHNQAPQGYTQRGQVLGAGIGPGSNSQSISLDWYSSGGKAGLYVQRIVYDMDRYYAQSTGTEESPEVELGVGTQVILFKGGFELGASIFLGKLFNQHYRYKNDSTNLNATISIRTRLNGYR
jgi:hypothetical protein